MSVSSSAFIGYTVTIKKDLESDDFDKFYDFLQLHPEYETYKKNSVNLIIDGMGGEYVRIIYLDEYINDTWCDGQDYFRLRKPFVPLKIYDALNEVYRAFCNKDLEFIEIDYALWYHCT